MTGSTDGGTAMAPPRGNDEATPNTISRCDDRRIG
jgi:hypothetical protein